MPGHSGGGVTGQSFWARAGRGRTTRDGSRSSAPATIARASLRLAAGRVLRWDIEEFAARLRAANAASAESACVFIFPPLLRHLDGNGERPHLSAGTERAGVLSGGAFVNQRKRTDQNISGVGAVADIKSGTGRRRPRAASRIVAAVHQQE